RNTHPPDLLFILLSPQLLTHLCLHLPSSTTENIAISINCSHHNLPRTDFIHWYRQFPGRGPEFLVSAVQGSKQLQDPKGRLSVAADRKYSLLKLQEVALSDSALYLCAGQDTLVQEAASAVQ
uniref:Uncharacterized protein n=1 Tax=Melopsittacus undulatus TaxID=13146 RepID=A0A8C6J492_MELUD